MFQRGRREFDLFAACVFGVTQCEPAFLTHRRDACVKSRGRAKFAVGHHVPNRKTIVSLLRARDEFQDFLFERIKRRKRRKRRASVSYRNRR